MQTIKTALVVTFLLAVLYGVYVTLNNPEVAGEIDAMSESEQWAGPDVQLPSTSGEAPDFSPGDLGEPSDGPPQFSGEGASDYPLPSFDSTGGPANSPEVARVADAYANEVNAPPLSVSSSNSSSPAGQHDHGRAHEHDEAGHGSMPVDAATYNAQGSASPANAPSTEATDAAPTSPYTNTRSETVVGTQQEPATADQPHGIRPHEVTEEEAASRTALAEYTFKETWGEAQQYLDDNRFARALSTLTKLYRETDLKPEHRQKLLDMLDRLAGTVIYSTEHRLEPPYEVARGETLDQIAAQYQVPSVLLFNINRSSINEPDLLLPGTQLKVMRGPFRAEVKVDPNDPTRGETTLYLGSLYAGRFPVTFGDDKPTPGRTYQVTERLEGKSFYQASGPPLEARSPSNPYGLHWLGFNDPAVSMHGLSRHGGEEDSRGSIRLAERDAADVFGILSVGSTVKVLQ